MISFESLIEAAKREDGHILPIELCTHRELLEARDEDRVAVDEETERLYALVTPPPELRFERKMPRLQTPSRSPVCNYLGPLAGTATVLGLIFTLSRR